jgi:hypothetical protein
MISLDWRETIKNTYIDQKHSTAFWRRLQRARGSSGFSTPSIKYLRFIMAFSSVEAHEESNLRDLQRTLPQMVWWFLRNVPSFKQGRGHQKMKNVQYPIKHFLW